MVCYSVYCLILVSASVLARDKQDFFMSCEYNREKQVLDSKNRSRSSYPPNLKGFLVKTTQK